MNALLWSREEVALRAKRLYAEGIRAEVETDANIGHLVVIDVETGEYKIEDAKFTAASYLREKHPGARLFAIRIGYNAAASFGGLMERTTKP